MCEPAHKPFLGLHVRSLGGLPQEDKRIERGGPQLVPGHDTAAVAANLRLPHVLMGENASEQSDQILLAQSGLIKDVAQRAGTDFAVQRDNRAMVTCDTAPFEGDVAAFLSKNHKARAPQGANQLTA
jgi:hypothetical protein